MPLTIGVGESKLVLPWPVVLWATTVILGLGGLLVQLQFTMKAQERLAAQIEVHVSGRGGDVITERLQALTKDLATLKGQVEVLKEEKK